MEEFTLNNDIKVLCITAASFPGDVMEAFQKLHSLISSPTDRQYFGISRPNEKDLIVYKAGAKEKEPGEAEKIGCEEFIIKSGQYIYLMVNDYMQNIPAIGKAFEQLISYPGIDPDGYCIELYLNDKDVKCMIRLQS